jgi:glycosyltransferase involved in cell wall biosynthesis
LALITAESSVSSATTIQISLVIPVYNQEKNVLLSLARIKKVLDSSLLNYEIVVVNDGSTDRTVDVLNGQSDPRVKIISYSANRGKGHAVKTGILGTAGDLVMFTDGDLDISPESIGNYVRELEHCDLAIASKYHPQSKVQAPIVRKFLSRGFSLLVRTAVGIKVKDTQSGLKAGNGNALRAIFKVMMVDRYAFDVELLTIATILKLRIRELPIQMNLERGFRAKEVARMFVDVARISFRFRVQRWYQKQLQSSV